MPRFFVEGEPQGEYFLGGEDGRHAARALRLRAGEPVTLCDGQGWDYPCTVLRGEDGGLWLRVEGKSPQPGGAGGEGHRVPVLAQGGQAGDRGAEGGGAGGV